MAANDGPSETKYRPWRPKRSQADSDEGLPERGPQPPAKQSQAVRCDESREESSSGHALVCVLAGDGIAPELLDLFRRVAGLGEDLVGVLAQLGRLPVDGRAAVREALSGPATIP